MMRARNANLALVFAGLLSMVGCCYHAQHFGSERDIGIGEEGCATCKNGCCPSKSSSTFAPGAGDDCCSSKSQCCPAKTTCSDCTTEPDTGRSKLPLTPVSRTTTASPLYVVQPEKGTTSMVVNPRMLLTPIPELPAP